MRRHRVTPIAFTVAAGLLLAFLVVFLPGSAGKGHGVIPANTLRGPAPGLPMLTSAGATPSAGDLGDPYALAVPAGPTGPARYLLFGTGDWPANVPTAVSSDLKTWRRGNDAMPVVPAWSSTDTFHSHIWAPTVRAVGGRWLLYVTVPDRRTGRQCIAVAASHRPEGPYTDAVGHPLVCQSTLGGSIDPSVASTKTGPVLLWKTNGRCCTIPATLWSQPLASNGLSVLGAPHPLLSATQPWQKGVVEEPAAVPNSRGGWWLFYSGGYYNTPGYAIGIASCRTLSGPCVDRSPTPYAASLPRQRSPGGLETFRDLNGRLRAVFDTWTRPPDETGHYDCCRAIDLADLSRL